MFAFPSLYLILTGLYIVNLFIAFTIIFLERKNPSATLAWIMILYLLPGVGILLYLFLSQNISRQRIFRLTRDEEREIDANLREQVRQMKNGAFPFANPEEELWKDMILLHQNYSEAFLTQDNRLSIFTDGTLKFQSLVNDIKQAKQSINVEYYILKNDQTGKALIQALTEKAKEGLEVRLLVDTVGGRTLNNKQALSAFRQAGGVCAFFFAPKCKYLNLKLNYRNHRKLVIIDGEIGYLGGFNVANEYLGKDSRFGNWRDTHLRLTGSCVQDMNARFLLDWRFAAKEQVVLSSAYYSEVAQKGTTGIQIVASGPDSSKSEIKHGYLKMISSAKRNIYIQTPYFIPDPSILEALRNAVFSGVDVRIMIPCMPDHPFVYWATGSYAGLMLAAGARIFIYQNGFLHAKTICVDGQVASVGSANFDIRSFILNFETNAFLYDAGETYKLEAIFESDIMDSHELTLKEYRARPLRIKFKESIARLLSDLL